MKPVNKIAHSQDKLNDQAGVTAVAIDPVCGMTVKPETAAGSSIYKDVHYYFCGTHCLHKFEADPERFLAGQKEPMPAPLVGITRQPKSDVGPTAQSYTCPMHPEVRTDKP